MNRFLIHVKIILLIRNKGEKHEKMVDMLKLQKKMMI